MVVKMQANSGGISINMSSFILQKKTPFITKPKWHAPWKLYRIISNHFLLFWLLNQEMYGLQQNLQTE